MPSKSILYCVWAASHSTSSSPSLSTQTQIFLLLSSLLFLCFFRCSWAIIVKNMVFMLPDGAPFVTSAYVFVKGLLVQTFALCFSRAFRWIKADNLAFTFNFCRTMIQMYQANKYYILDTKNKVTKWKKKVFSIDRYSIFPSENPIFIFPCYTNPDIHQYSWA